jgi:hypothetical protein
MRVPHSGRAVRAAAIIFTLPVTTWARAEPDGRSSTGKSSRENFVNPGTAVLELYVGPWSVVEKHYDPQGRVVATVEGTEEIAWIVDEHAIRRTYITSGASSVYRAFGVLSWDDVRESYRGVWLDNASTTGPSTVTGQWQADKQTMIYTVESQTGDGAQTTYKVVDRFVDAEQREATTYRIRGSEVVKLLDVQYKRTVPCPGRLRVIFDGMADSPRG